MTPTEEERKAATEWLENWRPGSPTLAKHAQTILAMLAEPRLPEEMDSTMRRIYAQGGVVEPDKTHHSLYAHLTEPKTRKVSVWHVERARNACGRWVPEISIYETEQEARDVAAVGFLSRMYACIRVTGPYDQEVPVS